MELHRLITSFKVYNLNPPPGLLSHDEIKTICITNLVQLFATSYRLKQFEWTPFLFPFTEIPKDLNRMIIKTHFSPSVKVKRSGNGLIITNRHLTEDRTNLERAM